MKAHPGKNQKISEADQALIHTIADRAIDKMLTLFLKGDVVDLIEDLKACHKKTPLDLVRLLNSSPPEFRHDLIAINRHCDGKGEGYTPHCLRPTPSLAAFSFQKG